LTVPTQWIPKAKQGYEAFTIVSAPAPLSNKAMNDTTGKGKQASLPSSFNTLVSPKVSTENRAC
jgi:hypothetical protein